MLRTLFTFDYADHEQFIAPARDAPELWRLIAGIFGVLSILWLGAPLIWDLLFATLSDESYRQLYDDFEALLLPQSLLLVLFSFGLLTLATGSVTIMLHRRGPETLIGPVRLFRRQARLSGLAIVAVTLVLFALPPWGFDPPLENGLALGTWLAFLVPALIAVLIQTSAEEIFFRGYMQQQLAARFAHPAIWLLVPSVLFGLLHYAPDTYGGNAWLVVIWAGIFGALAADLTARAGTLGPAIALHFLSNVMALLVIAPQGEMSGLALYRYPFGAADEAALRALLPLDFGAMLVSWLAIRLVLRR